MERHLRLHPGQEALTPAQEAEARRFAEKQIEAQLSSAPRDEQQAEQVLRQIYQAATYPPPTRIVWLDGPLPLVALRAPVTVVWSYMQTYDQDASVLESMTRVLDSLEPAVGMDPGTVGGIVSNGFLQYSVWNRLRASMGARLLESVRESVQALVQASVGDRVGTLVQESMWHSEPGSVISEQDNVWASLRASVGARLSQDDWDSLQDGAWNNVREDALYSVRAYADASEFALFHYFDVYLAPNELHALARFNALVSGYWLGQETALLARRPRVLARDQVGRLHHARGKCLEYPDGWGFYAWHGVRVPERVILAPDRLTREDFLGEPNLEVRRVIQERMGDRFVRELGGQAIDAWPRGTLYEVLLPHDPERVARYVQVQDVSTERQYFLRVPPPCRQQQKRWRGLFPPQ